MLLEMGRLSRCNQNADWHRAYTGRRRVRWKLAIEKALESRPRYLKQYRLSRPGKLVPSLPKQKRSSNAPLTGASRAEAVLHVSGPLCLSETINAPSDRRQLC